MWSEKKIDSEEITSNIYNLKGEKTAQLKNAKNDWQTGKKFSFDISVYTILKDRTFLLGDLVQSTDKSKVYIYFWPFKDRFESPQEKVAGSETLDVDKKKFNDLLSSSSFYIDLKPREYLTFKTFAHHAGPITIPFKVYLGSRDESHVSNVTTDVNAGVYYGWKWGKKDSSIYPLKRKVRFMKILLHSTLLQDSLKLMWTQKTVSIVP